tara:strand:- start:85 stop:954 length:870 start_codon:yes stop_codon:yes gene_type:complete
VKKNLFLVTVILLVNCSPTQDEIWNLSNRYNDKFISSFDFDKEYEKGCWIKNEFFDAKFLFQTAEPKKDIFSYSETREFGIASLYHKVCIDSDWSLSITEQFDEPKIRQQIFLECDGNSQASYRHHGPFYLFVTVDEPDKNSGSFVTLSFEIDDIKQRKNYDKEVTQFDKLYDVKIQQDFGWATWKDVNNKMVEEGSRCEKLTGRENCYSTFQYLDRETLIYGYGTRSRFSESTNTDRKAQCKISDGFSKDFNPYPQLSLIRAEEKEEKLKEKQEKLLLEEENLKKRVL